ncbi:MAG: AAA family ATPase, partial [Muribaculaceae bacterium]|nr:AAA family ATPase [Muribaculaceae bacterium]
NNLDNESLNNNGAGKSSIIESLVYALYGRTLRGLKGDAVVHNKAKKNMKIFLDLVDDDGTEYRIARYRKHSQNKNKSVLYMNGKDITPKSEADFNAAVADLLQADYLTFTSSLLYSAMQFS